jgi:hypothetical protein
MNMRILVSNHVYLVVICLHSHGAPTVTFPICPGLVATDMTNLALDTDPVLKTLMEGNGMKLVPASEVAPNIVKLVNEGTRETKIFLFRDGSTIPW